MKWIWIWYIAVICMAGSMQAQELPSAPMPAPGGPTDWNRVRSLQIGLQIVVVEDNAPALHCLFDSANEAYLFCNPPGNPPGVGFRIDRASIVSVDLDLPPNVNAQFSRPRPNYHPTWIASMIAGGLLTGIVAARITSNGNAAKDGLIGALVVGAIGAPLAFLPNSQSGGSAAQTNSLIHIRAPNVFTHIFSIR